MISPPKALTLLLSFMVVTGFSQPGALKEGNPFHRAYHDSLKTMDYPYTFPILGAKAYKKGFDIQFPWGIGVAYFAQHQQVLIPTTSISFNDQGPVDLSGVIKYGEIENDSYAFTVRPNLWVLPFVNIYGVFGTGRSTTTVPLIKPVDFTTAQQFDVSTAGVGITIAGGIGQVILIVDQNYNWADLEVFVQPVPAYNLDIRIGHNFVNPRRADRGFTVWFGTFYQQIKADTKGTIYVRDLFPGVTEEKKEEIRQDLDQWYNSLSRPQQAVVERVIQAINDHFDGTSPGDATISYELDKKLAGPWNLIFGGQYQHNKHWQIRTELGTFGERTQFLLNLNYCFITLKKRR